MWDTKAAMRHQRGFAGGLVEANTIDRLQKRLTRMGLQMRYFLRTIYGIGEDERHGDYLLHQMYQLRRQMLQTRHLIADLKLQHAARN